MRNVIKTLIACSLVAGLLISCESVDPQLINSSNPNVDYNPVKLVDTSQSSRTVVINDPWLGVSGKKIDSENPEEANTEDEKTDGENEIQGPSKNQTAQGNEGSESDSKNPSINDADSKDDSDKSTAAQTSPADPKSGETKSTASGEGAKPSSSSSARDKTIAQAEKYIDEGKYTQAITLLNGLLKTNPDDAEAQALLEEAQSKKAAADAEAAEKARQDKLDQARKNIDEGKYPAAITILNGLLKADPDDAEAQALLDEAKSKQAAAADEAAEKARQQKLDQARKYIDDGKYTQASAILNGLLKTNPDDEDAKALLKEIDEKKKADAAAKSSASTATSSPSASTAPKSSTTAPSKNMGSTTTSASDAAEKARQDKLAQAKKYIDEGKYAQAITLLNNLLKTNPDDSEAKALLKEAQDKKAAADVAAAEKARQDKLAQARKNIDDGKYTQAITILNGLLKTNPDDSEAKALLKEAQDKLDAANAAAAEKARQDKLAQAKSNMDAGKYPAAITILNGLLKTNPDDSEAKALLKEAQDKLDAANAAAAEKVRQDKLAQAKSNIDAGKYPAAITILNGLLKTNPNDSEAKALLKEAQDKQAAAEKEAAEKARKDKLDQAKKYIDDGKYSQAATILNGLLKADPNDAEAKSLQKELEAKKKAAEDAAKAKAASASSAATSKPSTNTAANTSTSTPSKNTTVSANDAAEKARQQKLAQARSYIDSGKYAQAITLLNGLLKTNPDDAEAKALLKEAQDKKAAADAEAAEKARQQKLAQARTYINDGKYAQAITVLNGLLKTNPNDSEAKALLDEIEAKKKAAEDAANAAKEKAAAEQREALAKKEAEAKAAKEAAEAKKKALQEEDDARQKRIDQAKAYIAEKKYANATNILNALLKADPNDKEAQALLDQIKELQKKEEQEAIDEAARAREQKLQQAREYMEQGKYALAISTLNGILKTNPDDKEAKDLLDQIQKLQDKAAEEAAAKARQQRLDQARAFIDSKKYTNAINVLNGLLKTNPNDAEAKALLEEAQNKKKIDDEEKAAKDRASKLAQAKSNIDAGKYAQAITILNGLLKTNPNDAEAKALLKEAQDKQSAANAEAAEKARQDKLAQAKANIDAGKYSAAITTLNGLLKTNPNDAEAKALLKEAQDKQSAANAEAAEKARQDKLAQAKANIDAGKYSAAITTLNGLLKTNPNDAEAKALLKEAQDKQAEADKEAAEKARRQKLDQAKANMEAGKYAPAITILNGLLKTNPNDAEAKALMDEIQKRKDQEAAEAKKKADEAAAKKAQEAAEAKKKADEAAAKKAQEAAEAKKKAEEEAAKKAQEAEAKKKAEEEAVKKAQAEAEAKKKAEEEAAKKAQEAAEAKKKAEEEAEKKAQAAAEAKKKAEEDAAKKAQEEAEAKKKAEEEAARLAAQKAADLDKLQRFTTEWESPMLSDIEDCGYFYTSPEFGQFDMIEGEFSKKSGYTKSAYGFVFGYTKPSPRGQLYNYIRFEINTDGEYALYKWDGKTYTDLVEPNSEGTAYFYKSSAINEGYNATNKLKIQVVNGKYNVYINNHLIKRGIPFIEGGTYGVMGFFSVGQANQEDLPNTPVVVSYRITDAELHRN